MYVLVTYDIKTTDPEGRRRLRHAAKICVDYGQRVQDSVFELKVEPAQLGRVSGTTPWSHRPSRRQRSVLLPGRRSVSPGGTPWCDTRPRHRWPLDRLTRTPSAHGKAGGFAIAVNPFPATDADGVRTLSAEAACLGSRVRGRCLATASPASSWDGGVAPSRGRGLKPRSRPDSCRVWRRRPFAGAWIETQDPDTRPRCTVAPSRGRGLKPPRCTTVQRHVVAPSRGRGLKPASVRGRRRVRARGRPLAGAWIETRLGSMSVSAPMRGRPFAGAWIETDVACVMVQHVRASPLRGGVD